MKAFSLANETQASAVLLDSFYNMETFKWQSNLTQFQNPKLDFWHGLFDTAYTKHLIFDLSILTIAILFPLFILIFIWY